MGPAAMVRAVVFDFNGVIVDDEPLHYELFRDVLAEQGVSLTELDYHEKFLGFDDRGCFAAALEQAGKPADGKLVEALIARKARKYEQAAITGLKYFPGARECIQEFSRIWPIAVCSGALCAEIEFALQNLGIRSLVKAIVAAEDVSRCKPDPEGYLNAVDALRGLNDVDLASLMASDCVAIEDSVAGITAASEAGMFVVGVAHTYKPEELAAAGAHLVKDDLRSISPEDLAQIATRAGGPQDLCLLVSKDLIFTTKVNGTASALKRRMLVANRASEALASIAKDRPRLLIVDLNAGEAANPQALLAYRDLAPPSTTLIAVGSHVDAEKLREARGVGFDAMPRSRFSTELAKIIEINLGPIAN